MMVDNAIVVADGFVVCLQKGMDRTAAALEAATQPSMLLLGATVIAVLAFFLIAASNENAGEYCASLFGVIPLLQVVFWIGLAVTTMAGLKFGTLLTMVLVPVLYALLFRIDAPTHA